MMILTEDGELIKQNDSVDVNDKDMLSTIKNLCDLNSDLGNDILGYFVNSVMTYLKYKAWDLNDVGDETYSFRTVYSPEEIEKILKCAANAIKVVQQLPDNKDFYCDDDMDIPF
ncbi:hypothetical protein [Clostridium estertheticum]|uniref:hypothetical protein n=1 Tax=Clostridium estertheticum TaxID=238834 RepID=UPI001C7D5C24|nr:hypothetical protein [Clostridium estertheticum]MBX4271983.1 hypothetical protein [Clostridium estertheticum]WLC80748.1 hypothetical protein KTC98_05550 [Clostridium estertheticum]